MELRWISIGLRDTVGVRLARVRNSHEFRCNWGRIVVGIGVMARGRRRRRVRRVRWTRGLAGGVSRGRWHRLLPIPPIISTKIGRVLVGGIGTVGGIW